MGLRHLIWPDSNISPAIQRARCCAPDKASGKDTSRPQLAELLAFVREGDSVVVHSMDRLTRNLDDLRKLVQQLTQLGGDLTFDISHLGGVQLLWTADL